MTSVDLSPTTESSRPAAGELEHHEAVDATPAKRRPRVLMVVANATVSSTVGWPVGIWAAERFHPWYAFTRRGYDVTVASPDGGDVALDAWSDPRDASRWSADDLISMGALHTPEVAALLQGTPSLGDVDDETFDALLICGGQAPMFQFRDHDGLKALVRRFYESGRPTAALCHGTSVLCDLTLSDGSYLVAGRTVTGFANVEEDYSDAAVGQRVMPFRIEDVLRERGANYVQAGRFKAFAVRDGHLITGQQQYSGQRVAEMLIAALGD